MATIGRVRRRRSGCLATRHQPVVVAATAPGVLLVARLYHHNDHQRGIERASPCLFILGVGSYAVGGLGCAWLTAATDLQDGLAWTLNVAIGYLAWSRLARSIAAAAVAGMILAAGVALAWLHAPAWNV